MFAKVPDEPGQYVMHFIKGNFSKVKTGLRFTIGDKVISEMPTDHTGQEYRVPHIIWGEEDSGTADDLLRREKTAADGSNEEAVEQFLREFLTVEKSQNDVETEAKKRGLSVRAIDRAKRKLGVRSNRPRKDKPFWSWELAASHQPGASEPEKQEDIPF
jgi:hypothetical protein